jgi:hypothetical protein
MATGEDALRRGHQQEQGDDDAHLLLFGLGGVRGDRVHHFMAA